MTSPIEKFGFSEAHFSQTMEEKKVALLVFPFFWAPLSNEAVLDQFCENCI
jgi:hypothetical protein